jgi:hypothetical protein
MPHPGPCSRAHPELGPASWRGKEMPR